MVIYKSALGTSLGMIVGTWDNVPALAGTTLVYRYGDDPREDHGGIGYIILVDDTLKRVRYGSQWRGKITEVSGSAA